MVNVIVKTLLIISAFLISACGHISVKNSVPALLSDVDADAEVELHTAVTQLLNQETVLIAQDAFQYRSYITVERLTRKDSQGNRIQGRMLDMPEKIQLLLINGECILKRESNNDTVKLENVKCVQEK